MEILYVDESGNSGLTDLGQPFFLYGGIFLNNTQWRTVYKQIHALMVSEKTLIASRSVANVAPSTYSTADDVDELVHRFEKSSKFLRDFHFHAKDIVRGSGLWMFKQEVERFELLRNILRICEANEVKIYVGEFDKKSFISNVSPEVHSKKLIEYEMLIPFFFSRIEQELLDDYVIVRASGDIHETKLISESLSKTNNFFPDDFIIDSKKSPMLQIADVVLWTLQAYKKIDHSKEKFSSKEEQTIETYKLLERCKLTICSYNPIYAA